MLRPFMQYVIKNVMHIFPLWGGVFIRKKTGKNRITNANVENWFRRLKYDILQQKEKRDSPTGVARKMYPYLKGNLRVYPLESKQKAQITKIKKRPSVYFVDDVQHKSAILNSVMENDCFSDVTQDNIDVSSEVWGPKKGKPVATASPNIQILESEDLKVEKELRREKSFHIPDEDIDTLKPGKWLSATIVDWGVMHFLKEFSATKLSITSWDQLFCCKLANGSTFPAIETVLSNNYATFDWLIGALNCDPTGKGNHWILILIDRCACTIYILNSLLSIKPSSEVLDLLKSIILVLGSANSELTNIETWKLIVVEDVPQQPNSYDCGIYCIFWVKALLSGKDAFLEASLNLEEKRQELKNLVEKPSVKKVVRKQTINEEKKLRRIVNKNFRFNKEHSFSRVDKPYYYELLKIFTK